MILKPDWPTLPAQFGALTTLRAGGVSRAPYGAYGDRAKLQGFNLGDHVGDEIDDVLSNRALLSSHLPNSPQWLRQVHGTTVLNLDNKNNDMTADACITTQPGVVCAILTADCLPVLFCDAQQSVIGAAHAGWRGLADGVLEKTVAAMQVAGAAPENIIAWLGPAIGPNQFEVGAEVRGRFVDADLVNDVAFREAQGGKFYADIYQLAKLRLNRVGVHHISGGEFCTFSDPYRFYSYRRDGVTGRMASLIWMK